MLFSRSELKPLLQQVSTNDPSLTSLHLSHKKITNKQLLQISDALQSNTNISELWLTNNAISDSNNDTSSGGSSVGYLMGVLESNRSVEEVYLGGNKIGAKGVSSIANLLQKNSTITDIGLEDNDICDGSAKMLADALSHNTTLQTLKLQGNDIQTESTLQTIHALLKKNREAAKAKNALEHPELQTRILKKPEKEKKKKSSRRRRSGEKDGGEGRRSKESSSSSSSRPRNSSNEDERKPSASRSRTPTRSNSSRDNNNSIRENSSSNTDASAAFLEERKKSIEEMKPPSKLADKLKTGLKLGGGKGNTYDAFGTKKKGMTSAAFV